MSQTIYIKKGLDIKLHGEAEKKTDMAPAGEIALKPTDFNGVFPKLFVKEGDPVKAGTAVFFDKYRDNIVFTSPVSGTVTEVRRGAKRVMLEIVIRPDGKDEHEDFGKADPKTLHREQVAGKLLKSGIWPHIRQRPYSVIANPQDNPKSVFISAFDSSPLAPDYDYILEERGADFQTGLNALTRLTDGPVYLNLHNPKSRSKVFKEAANVEIRAFSGPHPAGNVGTQISRLDPINKGDIVWYVNPQAVVAIGKLFNEGIYDATRTIALTGSEVKNPRYYKTTTGVSMQDLLKNNIAQGNLRVISGNVLTGKRIEKIGYLGFYDYQITVIPEGDYYEFFGWAAPRLNKFSFSRSFFSWLMPNKQYRLDTNLNGGKRAFVITGEFEKVFPFDIYPMHLIKSIMIEDIEQMENLGIYEVDEEDFALCEFIDPSKTDIQAIVRKGLDLMRKEMS
ncbi:MAG: Na(+)-translocating NADH-quinone reductase subunit A [Bacteroidales bacterium]|nr:Na(+)-translocating NADH-quinone reductase subunit A [Bacteroidales bacterium]